MSESSKLSLEQSARKSALFIVIVAVIAVGAYMTWFYVMHDRPLSTNTADWAYLGDFLGGVLGPLVAFAALRWLVVSVRIQQKEMLEANKAMRDAASAQAQQGIIVAQASVLQSYSAQIASINDDLEITRAIRRDVDERHRDHVQMSRAGSTKHFVDEKTKLDLRTAELIEERSAVEKKAEQLRERIMQRIGDAVTGVS